LCSALAAKAPRQEAELLVTWFELGYVPAKRFNLAGHIMPSRLSFGLSSPASMRRKYGAPLMKCQSRGLTSRANFYQNFVVLGNGLLDILDLHVWWSVWAVDAAFMLG
jgi:hypothetical protein